MKSSLLALSLLFSGVCVAATAPARAPLLKSVSSRDSRILKRWSLSGQPHALALGPDGTIYVGLARRQSIVAFDPARGSIVAERILDREEIASTKEIVTLRIDSSGRRLIAANGSDESVSILSIPGLNVTREIGLEGEAIRDAIPDPQNRYLFVLGRVVHVFDRDGERELRTLETQTPMAIAVSRDGTLLAVVTRDSFPSGPATVVVLYDTSSLKEVAREPLETDREIRSAVFGANDRALVVVADNWLAEKDLVVRAPKEMRAEAPRLSLDFGDMVSSETICLAANVSAQILALTPSATTVFFVERRCGASGAFTAAPRKVRSASLYGVPAFAAIYDPSRDALVVTDPAGYLTIYKAPVPPLRK